MTPLMIQGDAGLAPECYPTTTPACSHVSPYVTEGYYILAFDLSNSPDSAKYPGILDIEVDYGFQQTCDANGEHCVPTQKLCETYVWGTVLPHHVIVTCPAPGYIVIDQAIPEGYPEPSTNQGGQPFVLRAFVPGWALDVRNITFTFTADR
jgi:hypothetical protein